MTAFLPIMLFCCLTRLSLTSAFVPRRAFSRSSVGTAVSELVFQKHQPFASNQRPQGIAASSNLSSQNQQFIYFTTTSRHMGSSSSSGDAAASNKEPRKAGVASPEELQEFVNQAGDRLLVIDTRNPDASVEPGDQKSLAVAGLPTESYRLQAKHLPYDRVSKSLPDMPAEMPKDTPIITHCGGGGRGQLAKEYLEQHGFTNVLNGGGPKETECWAVYGSK